MTEHQEPRARTSEPIFQVDDWTNSLGDLVARWQSTVVRLGNLESRLFHSEIAEIPIEAPIYVTGLARSGTTILLEALARHPDTATHRYRDFPPVLTPILWNRFLDRLPPSRRDPSERAHRDGIMVTPNSPEAFEEVVWMAFFPGIHDPAVSDRLDGSVRYPAFEAFYRDHIRKLLWLRGGRRYLTKANYNVTRLEYLLSLFPDARFVVPVRSPVWHVASMMKQHALFCAGERQDRRASRHLHRVGHFEFGLGRRPINAGDPATADYIRELWREGREIEGWARYWSHIYGFLADRLEVNLALREATTVVRFEDLCRSPARILRTTLTKCDLPYDTAFLERLAGGFYHPSYYRPPFSAADRERIEAWTQATAERYGYRTSGGVGEPGETADA